MICRIGSGQLKTTERESRRRWQALAERARHARIVAGDDDHLATQTDQFKGHRAAREPGEQDDDDQKTDPKDKRLGVSSAHCPPLTRTAGASGRVAFARVQAKRRDTARTGG